jgi:hypothetical protein
MNARILFVAILLGIVMPDCAGVPYYELTPVQISDPGSILVGKWEGTIMTSLARRNLLSQDGPGRTLIIESVSNGKFYGQYGLANGYLGPMAGNVIVSEGHVRIEFVTYPWKAEISLGLVSPNKMSGTFMQKLDDGRFFPMEFTKR